MPKPLLPVLGIGLFAFVSACGPAGDAPEPGSATTLPARAADRDVPKTDAPAAQPQPRPALPVLWTGTFAANAALCATGYWQIERDRVRTGGETFCRIREVREGVQEVRLTLSCTAEGMETQERWRIEGDSGPIRLTRNQDPPLTLIRCP